MRISLFATALSLFAIAGLTEAIQLSIQPVILLA